jgi:hypothetical protein
MNDLNQHTNSELISLLLDGQLDREQEKTLYQNISADSEMQEELQELLSIRESVKKDYEAYNPPAELTNKVFAGLGYSAPLAVEAPTAATAAGAITVGFFKRMLPYVALVVAGFSIIVFNQFKGEENAKLSENKISGIVESGTSSEKSNLYTEESDSQIDNAELSQGSINSFQNNQISQTHSGLNSTDKANFENIPNNASEMALNRNPIQLIDNSNPENSTFYFDKINIDKPVSLISFSDYYSFNSYWYIQALGIFAGSMAENNLPTQSSAIWSNINFGIFRQLNKSFSLGVQFGTEPYNIYQTDNNDVAYLSSKDVFWVTLAGKYDMSFASFYSVTPYVSLAAGGSTVGFMSRGMAGLNYKFERLPVDFNIGYEASMINYSVFKDYTATKNGIVAGINIRF